jgi:hypothetical protein
VAGPRAGRAGSIFILAVSRGFAGTSTERWPPGAAGPAPHPDCASIGGVSTSIWYRATWLLLVLLALLPVVFPLLDVAGTLRAGIPSDHAAAFRTLAGQDFSAVASTGPARYVRQLELGYALHELTFGLFFLVIVAIPFRAGQRWSWWACWIALLANIGYTLTFARYGATTLAYSLVPDVVLPLLLLAQVPRFFGSGRASTAAQEMMSR